MSKRLILIEDIQALRRVLVNAENAVGFMEDHKNTHNKPGWIGNNDLRLVEDESKPNKASRVHFWLDEIKLSWENYRNEYQHDQELALQDSKDSG